MRGSWEPELSPTIRRVPERPLYVARIRELALSMKDVVKLTSGEPDFPTPGHIVDAAKKALDDGYTHYTSSTGLPEFKEAVSGHLNLRGGDYKPADILVTAGAIEGLYLVIVSLLGQGDECIIPDPGYTSYESMVCLAGATPVPVPVDSSTQNLKATAIAAAITPRTKLLILNSPSNPTGGVISPSELRQIADVCKERKVTILSDEAYHSIVYGEAPFSSVLDLKDSGNVILVDSLSKTYAMTGWRVGYVAGPRGVMEALGILQTYVALSVNTACQKAGVAALTGPQESVGEMVREFKARRDYVVKSLSAMSGVKCAIPFGAFYVLPDVSSFGMGSYEVSKYLITSGKVGVYPGIGFGERGEGKIRISFAASMDNLEEGLRRMDESLKGLV